MSILNEQANGERLSVSARPSTPRVRFSLLTPIRTLLISDYFVLYLTALFFFVSALFFPSLGAPVNIANQIQNMWPLLAVAIGETFVLILGGIDLSVGATMGLTSVVGAIVMANKLDPAFFDKSPVWGILMRPEGGILTGSAWAVPGAIAAMLIVGMLVGFLNGYAVTRFNLAPFMVTLVTSTFVSAFALWLTQSRNISGIPDAFVTLGKGDIISIYLGPKLTSDIARRDILPLITYPFVISVGLAVTAQFILGRTVFGRRMFSIGTSRRTSEVSGLPNGRVITLVYTFSGLCAAVASILYSARLAIGQPSLGAGNLLLDVIGAAVIGGTSLFGGKGSVRGTFFGVAFFVLLLNILNAMRLSPFVIDAIKGLVILLAALLDVTRTRLINMENRT